MSRLKVAPPTMERTYKHHTGPYAIQRGVALPPITPHKIYPFRSMEVGDSFAVPAASASRCRANFKHYRPMRFATLTRMEKDIEVMRVWRIE